MIDKQPITADEIDRRVAEAAIANVEANAKLNASLDKVWQPALDRILRILARKGKLKDNK